VLLSALPALAYLGLTVYSLIDCLQTPADELNRLSRGRWSAAIILIPVIGAVGWLLAGRPGRGRHERAPSGPDRAAGYGWTAEGVAQHPIGPDDDPDFLAGLGRAQREQKRLLTRQEEDRRRREAQERRDDQDPSAGSS
jgi:phospholipase D-like protein